MIIFLEDEPLSYKNCKKRFERIGETLVHFESDEFIDAINHADCDTINAIEAVIIDSIRTAEKTVKSISKTLNVPTVVLTSSRAMEPTRRLLQQGADHVLAKPVRPEELLARIAAVKRRMTAAAPMSAAKNLLVHFDGREPEYNGVRITLRRRERRILEHLVSINGRRATKAQIFDAVYGLDEENFNETIIESHICRLRKTLREMMGYDPICSVRHLGYQIDPQKIRANAEDKKTVAA
ncbi:MAG: winged helix-turn-helix domain-containing protein [Rhizobiaceae bacterium]|nr:winged helix-turn-helix domain-containing protein [Rhizobiaceae bacterium]